MGTKPLSGIRADWNLYMSKYIKLLQQKQRDSAPLPADSKGAQFDSPLDCGKSGRSPPPAPDPLAPAHRRLEEVIDEVAAIWNALPAPQEGRPWLEPAVDQRLEADITSCVQAKDLPGALAAIEAWREAWLKLLPQPAGGAPTPEGTATLLSGDDYVAVQSELLGEVVVFVRNEDTTVPAELASVVRYTLSELEKLQGLGEAELRAIHAAKKALGGRVIAGPDLDVGSKASAPAGVRPKGRARKASR
jgi:hypothetical protein